MQQRARIDRVDREQARCDHRHQQQLPLPIVSKGKIMGKIPEFARSGDTGVSQHLQNQMTRSSAISVVPHDIDGPSRQRPRTGSQQLPPLLPPASSLRLRLLLGPGQHSDRPAARDTTDPRGPARLLPLALTTAGDAAQHAARSTQHAARYTLHTAPDLRE
jgi:hypothetical protein